MPLVTRRVAVALGFGLGTAATILTFRLRRSWRGRHRVEASLRKWLQEHGLAQYGPELAHHGYDSLSFLAELLAEEVDELIAVVHLRPGHAAKLRKRLAQLRNAAESCPTAASSAHQRDTAGPGAAPCTAEAVPAAANNDPMARPEGQPLASSSSSQPQGSSLPTASPEQASAAAHEGSAAPDREHYVISIPPTAGPIGLHLSPQSSILRIVAVLPEGRVEQWNKENANCQVQPGDQIEEVDGIRGTPAELAELLQRGQVALILLSRPRRLSVGMRAVLCGLASKPELNGQVGTLSTWDDKAKRWNCVLGGGKTVRVKNENLQALGQPSSSSSSSGQGSCPAAPDDFRCCITQDIMEQPVITSDGHTYERAAITRWLEEHNTSPRTGQEVADRVLRPNHVLRAQIIRWREEQGLPPLPAWEPEPQEVVQTQAAPTETTVVTTMMTIQTPAGSFTVPVPNMPPGAQMVAAGGTQMVITDQILSQLLQSNASLREIVLQARGEVAGSTEAPQEDDVASLVQLVTQQPRLSEVVMRWLHSDPDARAQLVQLQGGLFGQGAAESPLFRAAREGVAGVVEQLLGPVGANPDQAQHLGRELSSLGDTLLHVACWHGHTRLVQMLLSRGHTVDVVSRNRSTPLHYAAYRGHPEIVGLLISDRADTERKMMGGDAPLHQAAWQNHVPVLQRLLDARASLTAAKDDGDLAIMLAAARGHVGASRELLSRMVASTDLEVLDVRNNLGRGLLHAAGIGGSREIVDMIIEARVPVDAKSLSDETPLHFAVLSGNADAASALLSARCEPDYPRREDAHTPLHLALADARSELVGLLVEHRASLMAGNRRDGINIPPVHMATIREATAPLRQGQRSVIATIAELRADLSAVDHDGNAPLHLLLRRAMPGMPHRITALRALAEHRADLETATRTGERPLHIVVGSNMRMEAALLIEHRADVNASGSCGAPLHAAAHHGARDCVELLLHANADPSQRNDSQQTSSDVARQCGFTNIEQLIQEHLQSSTAATPDPQ